jgi:prevent-host-death family protein
MDDANTTTVGVRELKTRLGTYLRLVRQGSRLIVTDRGRPVAQLCPLDRDADDLEALLHEMTLVGEATRASTEELTPFEPLSIRGKPISETISDGREDRV